MQSSQKPAQADPPKKPRGSSFNLFKRQEVMQQGLDNDLISRLAKPFYQVQLKDKPELKPEIKDKDRKLDTSMAKYELFKDLHQDYKQLEKNIYAKKNPDDNQDVTALYR